MNASIKIILVLARRSEGLLFLPVLVLLGLWMVTQAAPQGVVLWVASSQNLRNTVVLLGPFSAALSAWAAGRDRRRGADELLSTTPFPAPLRAFTNWVGVTFWPWLAYSLTASLVIAYTASRATWGTPSAWILVGILAIGAYSAVGFLFGSFVSTPFAIPLVPAGLYIGQAMPTFLDKRWRGLSPVNLDGTFPDPWIGLPGVIPISFWLLTITASGLGLFMLGYRRNRAYLLAVAGLMGLVALSTIGALRAPSAPAPSSYLPTPHELVCTKSEPTTCVHPAYESVLSAYEAEIHSVFAVAADIVDGPIRVVQGSVPEILDNGTFVFIGRDASQETFRSIRLQIASLLVAGVNPPRNPAQQVIIDWLLRNSGGPEWYYAFKPEERSALDQFDALAPMERTAWLEDHVADLRAGVLVLGDMP